MNPAEHKRQARRTRFPIHVEMRMRSGYPETSNFIRQINFQEELDPDDPLAGVWRSLQASKSLDGRRRRR